MSIFNADNSFSFMGSPVTQGTMFQNNSPATLPLAVDPNKAGTYNMQNDIVPGEWDWMSKGNTGTNLNGMLDGLAKIPMGQQDTSMPSAGNSNLSSRGGAAKMSMPVVRAPVPMPGNFGFLNNTLMNGVA